MSKYKISLTIREFYFFGEAVDEAETFKILQKILDSDGEVLLVENDGFGCWKIWDRNGIFLGTISKLPQYEVIISRPTIAQCAEYTQVMRFNTIGDAAGAIRAAMLSEVLYGETKITTQDDTVHINEVRFCIVDTDVDANVPVHNYISTVMGA